MLDRPEVYPYQRVLDSRPRQTRQKRKDRTNRSLSDEWQAFKNIIKELHLERAAVLLTPGHLLAGVCALLMARAFILGELVPFMTALLVAFGYQYHQRTLVMTVFGILGYLTVLKGMPLWYSILTLLVLSVVINYVSIAEEKKTWGLPLLGVSVILVVKTLLLLISGHMTFYEQMVVVFEALISGVLIYVFMVSNSVIQKKKPLASFTFEEMASFVILGIGLVMGLNDVYILQMSIGSILSKLGILVAAFLWGSGAATMVGVMAGIIPSISSSVFAQTLGMYAISGLLAGLFAHFGRLGIVTGFMLGTLALSMFIPESQVAILGVWETVIAAVLFFLLPPSLKARLPQGVFSLEKDHSEVRPSMLESTLQDTARNRIYHMAHVFDELSSSFHDPLALHQHSRDAYLTYLYDELSGGFCEGCSRYRYCWESDCYNTTQQIIDILTMIEQNGQVHYEDCSSDLKRSCLHARELVSTINYLFDNLRMNEYWTQRMDESRSLVSRQLKGVGDVVRELAEEMDLDAHVDLEMRSQLLDSCRHRGIEVSEITPIRLGENGLSIKVLAPACADGLACTNRVTAAVSSCLGYATEVSDKKCPGRMAKGLCEFTLQRVFNYRVESGAAQVARDGICGDSVLVSTLKDGKELLVVSDGMGVGEQAHLESQMAVRLLQNLLEGGFDKQTALKTINSVLLLRSSQERFTTLDMVLIDLYTADVDFIKTASAPSFIKRGRQVALIRSSSLPMGIMEHLDVVSERRVLLPNDMLLMVTDGVVEASREVHGEEWISQLLTDISETDPQVIAEMVIHQALMLCNGKPRDDMTAVCLILK